MRDFLRGCIDGDGSIVTYTDRYNTFKKPAYVYTRVHLSLVSASPRFLEWLRETLRRLTEVSGHVQLRRSDGRNDLWRLRYAKGEALRLLRWMYYSPEVPCLRRKYDIAAPFLIPPDRPRQRGPCRPVLI